MKIGIGNDHVAVEYKNVIREYIEAKDGYEVINYGTDSSERFNYPVSGDVYKRQELLFANYHNYQQKKLFQQGNQNYAE